MVKHVHRHHTGASVRRHVKLSGLFRLSIAAGVHMLSCAVPASAHRRFSSAKASHSVTSNIVSAPDSYPNIETYVSLLCGRVHVCMNG
mgnify:CR=1 FL=1